ncbi:MAG: acetyl esterase [Opitutaceae bacterium]|jgi:sialate O-acetylesterase|nr:acetyl esterase [Opitutaceae bacterium]
MHSLPSSVRSRPLPPPVAGSGVALAALLIAGAPLAADVSLPAIFSDHMVLQRTANVPLWGTAAPGEHVTLSLDGQTVETVADADGKWKAALDLRNTSAARGPFTLNVRGKNRIDIADVLVGEVWLASGQSNMEFSLERTLDAEQEIARSARPGIREFAVESASSRKPQADCKGRWIVASPETTGKFSATAWYFARKLEATLQTPVGIINSSWGGSPVEAWTSAEALDTVPELKSARVRQTKAAAAYPAQKKRFVDAFSAWLKKTGREDQAAAMDADNIAAFASPDVPASAQNGWQPVTLSGTSPGQSGGASGLPLAFGALWLRQEVVIPAFVAGRKLRIDISSLDGYETVCWDGRIVGQTTFRSDPGQGSLRRAWIAEEDVREGRHTLAIRIWSPAAPIRFGGVPRANLVPLGREWMAKTGYTLPPLSADAAPPRPPPALPRANGAAAGAFNAMIHPLVPFAIHGVIWYQGEANVRRAWQYRTTFPLLIGDWRKQWGRDGREVRNELPFYFCQLPACRDKQSGADKGSTWAELREAQSQALRLPGTGQAVLVDAGESADIHPRDKRTPGERLAQLVLAREYGRNLPSSGPVWRSMTPEGGKIRIRFDHTTGGLKAGVLPAVYQVNTLAGRTAPLVRNSPGSELEGFAVCGEDRRWVWAEARIAADAGDSVLVWSDKVPRPVAVRYAWADNPTCNLANGEGLPAAPFRTDDFPAMTRNAIYR